MKRLTGWSAVLAAVLAGCAAPQKEEPLQKEIARLRIQFEQKDQQQRLFAEEVGKKILDLDRRLTELDGQIRLAVMDIEDLKQVRPRPVEEPGTTPEPLPPRPDGTDPIKETGTVLDSLRREEIDLATAIGKLLPIAKDAAPLVLDELRRHRVDRKYGAHLERILSTMPPDVLRDPLAKALTQADMRAPAARIIGQIGDRQLSQPLEPLLEEAGEDLRLTLASALARCRNSAGLRPLVSLLGSEKWDIRMISFEELKKVNRDVTYGYDPLSSPAENTEAIRKWDEWLEKLGDKVFGP